MARITENQAQLGWRIFNWIGIINQLSTARASRTLAELKLPFPQFIILNHFSHRPHEAKTVTGVASAMQQPQPGVTKTIQKMVARKFLRVDPAHGDGRSKLLTITPKGLEIQARAIAAFASGCRSGGHPLPRSPRRLLEHRLPRAGAFPLRE